MDGKSIIYLVVFVIYFGFIIITSIQSSKKVETMSDFTSGGNKMGLILGIVGAALFVLLIFMVATGLLEITYNISTP